jgi:hypothetical protein
MRKLRGLCIVPFAALLLEWQIKTHPGQEPAYRGISRTDAPAGASRVAVWGDAGRKSAPPEPVTTIPAIPVLQDRPARLGVGHPDGKPSRPSVMDADLKGVTVGLTRTTCEGNCPAYSLTIHGDGRVEYVGKEYVQEVGKREGQVNAAAIRGLLSEVERAKFLSIPDAFSTSACKCRSCMDLPTVVIDLRIGRVTHRVEHDTGCTCAPHSLFTLEDAIDKAMRVEQWTGDTSQAGAWGTSCSGP